MKASDIVKQLQIVLPTQTGAFSTQIGIVSIIPTGTTATVTSAAPHGLAINDIVNITGAVSPVAITSITRSETIATATTTTNHDITENDLTTTVTLSGSNESEFNGTFPFLSAKNRKTFQFTVSDSGATNATGSPLLEDPPSAFGYNGLITVDAVPSTTTFEYELPIALTEPAEGSPLLRTEIRVTGAVSLDRAIDMYTKQTSGEKAWAFAVLNDTVASKDRGSRNDAITSAAPGSDRRQQIFQTFSVYIFLPTPDELSARLVRDQMEDFMSHLFKSLLYWKAPNDLSVNSGLGTTFVSHGFEQYNTAYYVHEFQFQLVSDITQADTLDPDFNVAFRDIDLTMKTSFGTEQLTAAIDLDDDPLP